MDFAALYSFLFESFTGVGVLIVICLVVTVILSFVFEKRIRKQYVDRGPRTEDDWTVFDDDEESAAESNGSADSEKDEWSV